MPNNVTTILTIKDAAGVALADIRKTFLNDVGLIDFNVIAPSPTCLCDFEPSESVLTRARAALGLLPDPKTISGDDFASLTARLDLSNALRDMTTPVRAQDIRHVIRAIQNYNECGHLYWYDWTVKNWGVKWNFYGQPEAGHPLDATSFKFETAWRHPREMMLEISKRLPGVVFHVRYADEDIGSNCGEYQMKNGATFNEDIAARWDDMPATERRRWKEKAFRICYGADEPREAHGYDENWEYSDDVYEAHEKRTASVAH